MSVARLFVTNKRRPKSNLEVPELTTLGASDAGKSDDHTREAQSLLRLSIST